jgi:pimeloyl-ACP methyl ester carboxylesterase
MPKTLNIKWLLRIAIGLGIFWLSIALVMAGLLWIAMPVFRFPQPTGPNAIGTLTYHWIDTSRVDIFAVDASARRELMAQVWYPADIDPATIHAPYMQDADTVMAAFARVHGKPPFFFRQFKYVTTNAVTAARVADGQTTYPVLIVPVSATGLRQMNTFQVEELVSHGYIVVAIDQPGAAADVVFQDGREVVGVPVLQLQALIRPSHIPGATAPLLQGRVLEARSIVPFLTQDVSFALDQLAALNLADQNHVLTKRLDLQRVGAFGVSLGGIVTGAACLHEPRVRACLMMDAPMTSEVVAAGLNKPSIWITRDVASMRLERQRSGGWSEADIEAHQTSMRAVYETLPGSGYFVEILGTFHSNFMDIPNWTPLASWLNLAGPIDGQRAHDIINAYSLAFFNRHLIGHPEGLLDGSAAQYPEVIFESRHLH